MKKLLHINKNLTGDGRRVYYPNPDIYKFAYGVKEPLRLSTVRRAVNTLTSDGQTKHSHRGVLMWCLQEWCSLNKYDYSIYARVRVRSQVSCTAREQKTTGYLFELGDKQPFELRNKQP